MEATNIALISSVTAIIISIITLISNLLKPRVKANAQAQPDTQRQRERQEINFEWEDRYGGLVKRVDTIQRTAEQRIRELEMAIDNERDAREDAERRAAGQATVLIQLQAHVYEMTELVRSLSDENKRLYSLVESGQITNSEQLDIIKGLKRDIIELKANIVSLNKQLSISKAEKVVRSE